MATIIDSRNGIVIFITILISMVMMLLPLPDMARFFRPEWVLMTLIYWAMALPHRVSIGVAWLTGFTMDIIVGGELGVMAFSYALAIFIIARFHLQLRQYPLWQQAFTIFSVVLIVEVTDIMLTEKTGYWLSWMPVLTSTLLWPVMYAVLRKIRRGFQVT
ncbi:hypothetical protein LCGC14_0602570 [marine sediment metagenome]|uniref:Rod shape-determining protein MreD n=1 Tax=marine sediment metagenome TaxID=412755 RepID=A0A0F9UIN7_9ZZZZ|nr:rod shape-determining protein MreD [Methylophaga aminisulfidivorans]